MEKGNSSAKFRIMNSELILLDSDSGQKEITHSQFKIHNYSSCRIGKLKFYGKRKF
mgnify:CR=1 FL=1